MAYLGFQKGGPNVHWPLVLTQMGDPTKFSKFVTMWKKILFGQRGAMADLAKG